MHSCGNYISNATLFYRDTSHLAILIEDRDEILEKLEIAETRYINSFKLTTPEPSIDYLPSTIPVSDQPPPVPPKPDISRPRPLGAAVSTEFAYPEVSYLTRLAEFTETKR